MFFKHSHLKQKSYIANALTAPRHQHKNKTPTTGRLIISGGDEVFPRPAGGGAVGHS